jgi:Domain of unknown function (DUF1902)
MIVRIELAYDEEAKVWYVYQSDVPGLRLEADTFEELRERVGAAVADLLNAQLEIEGRKAVHGADLKLEVTQHQGGNERLRA